MKYIRSMMIAASVLVLAGTSACVNAGSSQNVFAESAGAEQDKNLRGSSWRIVFPVNSEVQPPEAFIVFRDLDSLSGSTGCNQFAGNVTIQGHALTVGPVKSTRRACRREWMERETMIFRALESVAAYRFDDEGSLLFLDQLGEILLTMKPRQ